MSAFSSMVFSRCMAIANWYWGGFDGLLATLVVFVGTAHIADGMRAIVDRRPFGRAAIRDAFKSILIFILVGIGNVLDTNVLTNIPALRTAIILFYISVEWSKILEDAVYLGLPIPEQLKGILERMRQKRRGRKKSAFRSFHV